MVPNKATVPRQDLPPADFQERQTPISLSTVVCLRKRDLSQPDRWVTNNLQASLLVSKVDMVGLQHSLQLNMAINLWDTEVLPVLGDTVVVLSQQQHNGTRPRPNHMEMALADTKVKCIHAVMKSFGAALLRCILLCRVLTVLWGAGISSLAA